MSSYLIASRNGLTGFDEADRPGSRISSSAEGDDLNISHTATVSCLIHGFCLLVSFFPSDQQAISADIGSGDGLARGAIFADQHNEEAALLIHQQGMKLEPLNRFDFLADRVLPGGKSDRFRLSIGFSPAQPALSARNATQNRILQAASQRGESRVSIGGELVSPALDLVHVARELGRLPDLRIRIEATRAAGEVQSRCRLAMLGLVDLALEDPEHALNQLR